MIVSHKYKFIFLKTNKTAGTSIEIALSKFCGKDDIISPILPADEKIRRELGYPQARNYGYASLFSYSVRDFINVMRLKRLKPLCFAHMPARDLRPLLGEKIWNSYYKFCFERNPWDRLVSMYYWRNQKEPRPTISEFLDTAIPAVLKEKGRDVYCINDKVAVDKIYLFENLQEAIVDIKNRLDLPEPLMLPRAKGGVRQDIRHYSEILTGAEKERIEKMFQAEIDMFGYQFQKN
jgi:hypothetical protein